MSAGIFTLATLLLAGQAGPADVYYMNAPRFSIPIRIDPPERRAEIKELILYATRDQGANWTRVRTTTSDKDGFPFEAPSDGLYWFAVATVDMQGQQDPLDLRAVPAAKIQRIHVDTRKPEARFVTLERKGDEVVAVVDIRDDNLQNETVKLEYRSADNPSQLWTPVPIQGGQAKFRPASGAGLFVRVLAKDAAGNEALEQREVAPVTTVLAGGPALVPPGPGPQPVAPQPPFQPLEALAPAPVPPLPLPQPQPPYQPAMATQQPTYQGQPLAHSSGVVPVSTASSNPNRNLGSYTPPAEITNKKVVKVDFEVAKFGPSGLGGVDVYLTADEGRTWEKSRLDQQPILPNAGEGRGGTPLQGSVMVPLPREGVAYGISIIVKSRAGLGKAPPQPGEAPQMRVELDTSLPEAKLFGPEPDGNRRDSLRMRWEATDKNLASNPITLEWSPAKGGPWYHIGAQELPNTGYYNWQVPHDVPPSVFLRLTVRDAAGNSAVAQTQEPVLVDLSVPEATIIRRPSLNKLP